MQTSPHIDDFPTLWGHLGKARTDRIRNHQTNKVVIGGPRTRWVNNPHHHFFGTLLNHTSNSGVDDILTGICLTDESHDKVRLSATRLFTLLSCNKRISTDLIKVVMQLEERQARRYMAAAKLAIALITRHKIADTWEISGDFDNAWAIELEAHEVPQDYSKLVRRSPTLAEIRAAHAAQTK
jgi:hypothetical protein